ncbi:MAG: hypothetical protein RMA76_04720 [Deltaproteobacteria bacterium]
MSPALLVLAAIASSARVGLAERTPALMVVALPKGAAPSTDLVRVADATFRAKTGLDVRPPAQAGVDAERLARCDGPARLACWVDAARSGRERLAAIVAITVLPVGDGRDRLQLTLIDTERAAQCRAGPGVEGREAREAIEDCIWSRSARTQPTVVDATGLPTFFEGSIDHELAPLLNAMNELAPFGRIEITIETPQVELWIDGTLRSTLAAGTTRVEEVRPGRRVLAFRRPGFTAETRPIHVERSRTATAAITLLPLGASPVARRVLTYSGLTAAAIGVSLGVYAIVRANAVDDACLAADEDAPCTPLGAPRFGLSTGDLPSSDRDAVNPGGISIPVVAAGIGLMGAGWAIATWWLDDDGGFPWVELLTGVGAGVAGATAAAVLDSR